MRFVSPTFKIRCPRCRKQFHPSDMRIVSLTDETNVLYKPPPRGSFRYYVSRFWTPEIAGEKYTMALARRVCKHCDKLLPEREIDETLNIAIVGDTSSGKTHYIAVLIDQLKRGVIVQAGSGSSRLISLDQETDRRYRDRYYKPIIEERDARTAGTQRGKFDAAGVPIPSEPLVYQLTLSSNATSPARAVNLLFYDIAGEDIADSISIVQFGEYILRADAILYLADPVTMERVRQQLPAYLQPDPASISARSAHEVLTTIMYRFEQYQRVQPGERVDVPTAIILSKSDLLRYTIPISVQRNFIIFQRSSYDGKAHTQELLRMHQEVESCLRAYNEQALLQVSKRFTNLNFFASSATGSPPDSNGKYIRIDPVRCLDPFIWVLWKLGCIDAG